MITNSKIILTCVLLLLGTFDVKSKACTDVSKNHRLLWFSFAILGSIMPFPNEEGTARDTKGNDNFNFKIFSNVTYKIQKGDNK